MNSKKQLRKLAKLLGVLSILAATSCGHVEIKDQEWCGDFGDHASCFHTLTDESRDLPRAEWDALRFGMVCTSSDNFADIKKVIAKLCDKTNLCNYEEQEQMTRFFDTMSAVNKAQKRMAR